MVFLIGTVVADVTGVVLLGKAQGLERPALLLAGMLAFVAAPAAVAVAAVVGVARRGGMPWYYLDDGLYGSFSNVMSDHVRPTIHVYDARLEERDAVPSVLAGPTCDSTDVIATDAMLPPLDVGDLVVAPFMGAYTTVTACEFNGLPKPTVVVVRTGGPVSAAR
ncbi:MAG TPA: hypothetical protein VGN47_12965 [Blastococcus sp.]|jgi:ornithine decarboxylase|nr:hypothetical protein [Blastococcus sp.]